MLWRRTTFQRLDVDDEQVLAMRLSQIDLEAGRLRLEPGTTKNGGGREVHLTPEHRDLVDAQVESIRSLSRRLNRVIPYRFPHLKGAHAGNQIRNFR